MIRLYDTLTRAKRDFVPQDRQRITMYVCGPTVYGRAHIGNARPAVVFDTLARLLRHAFGEKNLVYARNVTDVDDKIIAAAEAEGADPSAITERYERHYLEDMRALGVRDPDIAPHATHEIAQMIAMVERLVGLGHAYEAQGHVLFSVPSDPDYGSLSRRDREQMIAGARVEVAPYKRDPADFVLWKPSPAGVIGWDSPWGRGRPGWHLECSAMIERHLGQTIDIHGGGLDLVFPHHENEIAQSRSAHAGAPLARFWLHNGLLDMGAEKMSKSLGNIVLVSDLLEDQVGGALRLALLSAQYRQPLAWTEDLTNWSRQTFERWCGLITDAFDSEADEDKAWENLPAPSDQIVAALQDDLNTPEAIQVLHERAKVLQRAKDRGGPENRVELAKAFMADGRMLGLEIGFRSSLAARVVEDHLFRDHIEKMIAKRAQAKGNRDFAAADRIRDELKAKGIILEDGPSGTSWRRQ